MVYYFGVSKDEGLSRIEIDDVKAIVMAVAAGQVRAQFTDARRRHQHQSAATTARHDS